MISGKLLVKGSCVNHQHLGCSWSRCAQVLMHFLYDTEEE
ncbi:hypothetical protein NBRC111894_1129 [Sporolactobacillus inulinus]|uniref:Uncharacterized protein n=1 Tax=Sporolactobacillus inulinus TaxID=2078 RepID=A0A4Y1Z987_9BACL|nr:hypothetical protein NBRC111894_1129 [Sporolactobacillus inulinus]